MKYQLKPFFVEAILWTGDINTIENDCDWFHQAIAFYNKCRDSRERLAKLNGDSQPNIKLPKRLSHAKTTTIEDNRARKEEEAERIAKLKRAKRWRKYCVDIEVNRLRNLNRQFEDAKHKAEDYKRSLQNISVNLLATKVDSNTPILEERRERVDRLVRESINRVQRQLFGFHSDWQQRAQSIHDEQSVYNIFPLQEITVGSTSGKAVEPLNDLERIAKIVELARKQGFDSCLMSDGLVSVARKYCESEKVKGHNNLRIEGNRLILLDFLGNSLCKNNAMSSHLKCAMNPKKDCCDCQYFERDYTSRLRFGVYRAVERIGR